MATFGSARVSSREQNIARRLTALEAYGVERSCMYADMQSGRELPGALIADIVLQLLSDVGQTEQEMNRSRQREGLAFHTKLFCAG